MTTGLLPKVVNIWQRWSMELRLWLKKSLNYFVGRNLRILTFCLAERQKKIQLSERKICLFQMVNQQIKITLLMYLILETCWIHMLIFRWRLLSQRSQLHRKLCLSPHGLRVLDHLCLRSLQVKKMLVFRSGIKIFLDFGTNSPNHRVYLKLQIILKSR